MRKSPGESPAGEGRGREGASGPPLGPSPPLPSWELQSVPAPLLCASHPKFPAAQPPDRELGLRQQLGPSLRRSSWSRPQAHLFTHLKKLPALPRPGPGSAPFLFLLFAPSSACTSFPSPPVLLPEVLPSDPSTGRFKHTPRKGTQSRAGRDSDRQGREGDRETGRESTARVGQG